MDISAFKIVDLVFDPSFRKWILEDNPEEALVWKTRLRQCPEKKAVALEAKRILLRYKADNFQMYNTEKGELWQKVVRKTEEMPVSVAFLTGDAHRPGQTTIARQAYLKQWQGVAAILVLAFALGFLASRVFYREVEEIQPNVLTYKEHHTPKGVRSSFVLPDGTSVMMNSGSMIKYVEGFEPDKRDIILEGEVYFDVASDAQRPFRVVNNDDISIIALGTSFMVAAYPGEEINVSLLTGKVAVEFGLDPVFLEVGEGVRITPDKKTYEKGPFNKEQVMAWTNKTIYFDRTPIAEAIRVLENWFGMEVELKNRPPANLLLTGKFRDETLENVLESLSYTSKIGYTMKDKKVEITFDKHL
jgi:ferric-dicitrate binding protein FerR (iron transport regulator)